MHIRILMPLQNEALLNEGLLKKYQRDGLTISIDSTSLVLTGIDDEATLAKLTEKIVYELEQLAVKAEREGVDALIINFTVEIGFPEVRAAVSIPVLSPFRAGVYHAAMLGERLGIVGTRALSLQKGRQSIVGYGLEDRVKAYRLLSMDTTAQGTLERSDAALAQLGQACIDMAKEESVDTIILGSVRLTQMTSQLRAYLHEKGVHLLIIDPFDICIYAAEAIVRSQIVS